MKKLSKKNKVKAEKCIKNMSSYFREINLETDIEIYVLEVLLVNCLGTVIVHTDSIDLVNKFLSYKMGALS